MKRLDLVQLTIIIIGICSAFFCLNLLPDFVYYLFSWMFTGLKGGYMMDTLIKDILQISIYLLFSIYSISNSKQLAAWISNKANLHSEINLALQARELLFALLTGLAIYGLIKGIPSLLIDSYDYTTGSNQYSETPNVAKISTGILLIQIFEVALYIILLIYANVFAHFFANRIKNTEPPDEIMEKTG